MDSEVLIGLSCFGLALMPPGALIWWATNRTPQAPKVAGPRPPYREDMEGRPLSLLERMLVLEKQVEELRSEVRALKKSPEISPLSSDSLPTVPVPETSVAAPSTPGADFFEKVPDHWTVDPNEKTKAPKPPGAAKEKPVAPSPFDELLAWFTGENTVVKVGLLVLFFGLAFLLKFAADNHYFPIGARFVAVALGGIALLVTGLRLRAKRPAYALLLQGGAVGILYLTAFSALKFEMVPALFSLVALVVIAVVSALLAIKQDASMLAVLGITGGFLAPILTSDGTGSHVALFSYFALLNAFFFGMARYKTWRSLNVLGFFFTFSIATAWGVLKYQPEHLKTTEPFLILFFIFYTAIGFIYALRENTSLTHPIDATLVFGTPVVCFVLQADLVREIPNALGTSAAILALVHFALARVLGERKQEALKTHLEAYAAMGAIFATLAIPLLFDARVTSAIWAVEGAGLAWFALRQQRINALTVALLLPLISAAAFVVRPVPLIGGNWPLLNAPFVGCLMLVFSGFFTGFILSKTQGQWLKSHETSSNVFAVWSLLWWLIGISGQIDFFVSTDNVPLAYAAALTLTAVLCTLGSRQLPWPFLRFPALALIPALWIVFFYSASLSQQPFSHLNALGWLAGVAASWWILWRHDSQTGGLEMLHVLANWFIVTLAGAQLAHSIQFWVPTGVWQEIAWPLTASAALLLLSCALWRIEWPFAKHLKSHLFIAASPFALVLVLWFLVSLASSGNPAPFPYVPLLNPIDLCVGLSAFAMMHWGRRLKSSALFGATAPAKPDSAFLVPAASIVGFTALNATLLRTLHTLLGVPYEFDALMASTVVQASLSVFWTLIGVALMLLANRKQRRTYWVLGALLLAVVVFKLFFIDLSRMHGVERIVSFIVIGVLLLLIGYFSPLPPKREAEEKPT
jgi:uncharacterized membrane protein